MLPKKVLSKILNKGTLPIVSALLGTAFIAPSWGMIEDEKRWGAEPCAHSRTIRTKEKLEDICNPPKLPKEHTYGSLTIRVL